MTAPTREGPVDRRADPACPVCCGTGKVRVPTTKPLDLLFECDCLEPALATEAEVEAQRCADWDRVLP